MHGEPTTTAQIAKSAISAIQDAGGGVLASHSKMIYIVNVLRLGQGRARSGTSGKVGQGRARSGKVGQGRARLNKVEQGRSGKVGWVNHGSVGIEDAEPEAWPGMEMMADNLLARTISTNETVASPSSGLPLINQACDQPSGSRPSPLVSTQT
jgi:hypothetical protein